MGLYLNRDKDGGYRRAWYCKISEGGKLTGHRMKTPLRGKIPLDDAGRFSLALTGDAAYEKSKADALAELQTLLDRAKEMEAEERNAPGYIEREAYRKIKGRKFKVVAIADLAKRNAERTRYALTGDRIKDGNRRGVFDRLDRFSKWCARRNEEGAKRNEERNTKSSKRKSLKTLADIDRETVSAYYADAAKSFSWGTLSKHIFTLASVFKYFMPDETENPFAKVYEDEYKGRVRGSDGSYFDKTAVTHEAPTCAQVLGIWDCARHDEQHPFLYRLAVLAACSGLRIGDACRLTWDKVDMLNLRITTNTAKTGKRISVPIFDYNQESDDFHPVFGELRRELEAALAERKDGEKYVIPEAARIYERDPDRITKIGKKLFARALFANPEPEEARIVDANGATDVQRPIDILHMIEATPMQDAKKSRLMRTYELRTQGKTYSQIAEATGGRKSTISGDLAEIERLSGAKIRPGLPTANGGQTIGDMVRRTRQTRTQGKRAACLFGWHSMRVFFVVTAIDAGMNPDVLKDITGHSTVSMVLHYYNPEETAAAEKMRQQLRRERRAAQIGTKTPIEAQGTEAAANGAAILASAIQAVLAAPALTPEAKNAAIAAIAAKINGGGSIPIENGASLTTQQKQKGTTES